MKILSIAGITLLSSALSAANAQQFPAAQAANLTKSTTPQKGCSGPGNNQFVSGSNDYCLTPQLIMGYGTFPGNNSGATLDLPVTAFCGPGMTSDVWCLWSAPSTDTITISLCSSGCTAGPYFDPVLAVYTDASPLCTGTLLACNNDTCPSAQRSRVTFNAVYNQFYKIQIGSNDGNTGLYEMSISPSPSPGADCCDAPDAIAGFGAFLFDNSVANNGTEGQAESACLFHGTTGITHDIWYEWTSPSTGMVSVSVCPGLTNMNSKLAVYDGSGCPQSPSLGCNDDDDSPCGPVMPGSRVSFPAVMGHVYTIQLGNSPGTLPSGGSFTILGDQTTMTVFCFPNVFAVRSCPCGNQQSPALSAKGCNNFGPTPAGGTGGAALSGVGTPVSNSTCDVRFFVDHEPSTTNITVLFIGSSRLAFGFMSGAGVRCVGTLQVPRPYKGNATVAGEPAQDAPGMHSGIIFGQPNNVLQNAWTRSGNPVGVTKYYYAAYRNSKAGDGTHPPCWSGNSFNLTNAVSIVWP